MKSGFICVAGKNNIAVNVLEYILNQHLTNWEIGIICNKTETGKDSWQKSFRKYANFMNVKEYKLSEIYNKNNLIFISVEFDQIVNPSLFSDARLYNIHFSLLPAYKGMYTSAMPILRGDNLTGVTFHKIDQGIDTGDIIDQIEFSILEKDTCRDLYLKYIHYGSKLVIEQIPNILEGNVKAYPQSPTGSTYYSKKSIDYNHLTIDLNQTAYNIRNQIRAFTFREYQIPVINNKKILFSNILENKSSKRPGTIIQEDDHGQIISTIDYDIQLFYDRFDELLIACSQGDLNKVKDICYVRQHIYEKNNNGWSPLIVSTYYGHIDIVNYLISIGANIFDKNYNGTNLLMYAKDYFLKTGDNQLFKQYIKMGLDINEKDSKGKSVIDYLQNDGIDLNCLYRNKNVIKE